jgi:hypothetical protein
VLAGFGFWHGLASKVPQKNAEIDKKIAATHSYARSYGVKPAAATDVTRR